MPKPAKPLEKPFVEGPLERAVGKVTMAPLEKEEAIVRGEKFITRLREIYRKQYSHIENLFTKLKELPPSIVIEPKEEYEKQHKIQAFHNTLEALLDLLPKIDPSMLKKFADMEGIPVDYRLLNEATGPRFGKTLRVANSIENALLLEPEMHEKIAEARILKNVLENRKAGDKLQKLLTEEGAKKALAKLDPLRDAKSDMEIIDKLMHDYGDVSKHLSNSVSEKLGELRQVYPILGDEKTIDDNLWALEKVMEYTTGIRTDTGLHSKIKNIAGKLKAGDINRSQALEELSKDLKIFQLVDAVSRFKVPEQAKKILTIKLLTSLGYLVPSPETEEAAGRKKKELMIRPAPGGVRAPIKGLMELLKKAVEAPIVPPAEPGVEGITVSEALPFKIAKWGFGKIEEKKKIEDDYTKALFRAREELDKRKEKVTLKLGKGGKEEVENVLGRASVEAERKYRGQKPQVVEYYELETQRDALKNLELKHEIAEMLEALHPKVSKEVDKKVKVWKRMADFLAKNKRIKEGTIKRELMENQRVFDNLETNIEGYINVSMEREYEDEIEKAKELPDLYYLISKPPSPGKEEERREGIAKVLSKMTPNYRNHWLDVLETYRKGLVPSEEQLKAAETMNKLSSVAGFFKRLPVSEKPEETASTIIANLTEGVVPEDLLLPGVLKSIFRPDTDVSGIKKVVEGVVSGKFVVKPTTRETVEKKFKVEELPGILAALPFKENPERVAGLAKKLLKDLGAAEVEEVINAIPDEDVKKRIQEIYEKMAKVKPVEPQKPPEVIEIPGLKGGPPIPVIREKKELKPPPKPEITITKQVMDEIEGITELTPEVSEDAWGSVDEGNIAPIVREIGAKILEMLKGTPGKPTSTAHVLAVFDKKIKLPKYGGYWEHEEFRNQIRKEIERESIAETLGKPKAKPERRG